MHGTTRIATNVPGTALATCRGMQRIGLLALVLAAAACSSKSDAGNGGAPTTTTTTTTTTVATSGSAGDPAAKAKEIFSTRCTPCHGADGRGDGVASAALNPKPRNFHDQAWQAKVDDDHIMLTIKTGGAAVGLSAAMPSNPDLNDQSVLAALKDYVRTLGKQP
jgi:mono/diheme cytochrome c family protein